MRMKLSWLSSDVDAGRVAASPSLVVMKRVMQLAAAALCGAACGGSGEIEAGVAQSGEAPVLLVREALRTCGSIDIYYSRTDGITAFHDLGARRRSVTAPMAPAEVERLKGFFATDGRVAALEADSVGTDEAPPVGTETCGLPERCWASYGASAVSEDGSAVAPDASSGSPAETVPWSADSFIDVRRVTERTEPDGYDGLRVHYEEGRALGPEPLAFHAFFEGLHQSYFSAAPDCELPYVFLSGDHEPPDGEGGK